MDRPTGESSGFDHETMNTEDADVLMTVIGFETGNCYLLAARDWLTLCHYERAGISDLLGPAKPEGNRLHDVRGMCLSIIAVDCQIINARSVVLGRC